jgi:hypothetical protein
MLRSIRNLLVASAFGLLVVTFFWRFEPGNDDDKTVYLFGAAIIESGFDKYLQLKQDLPTLIAKCDGDERCVIRTQEAVSGALNYPLQAVFTYIAGRLFEFVDVSRDCSRRYYQYYFGTWMYHLVFFGLLLAGILARPSLDDVPSLGFGVHLFRFPLPMQLIGIASLAIPLCFFITIPGYDPGYGIAQYSPRGALSLVAVVQLAAYVGNNRFLLILLGFVSMWTHVGQALILSTLVLGILGLDLLAQKSRGLRPDYKAIFIYIIVISINMLLLRLVYVTKPQQRSISEVLSGIPDFAFNILTDSYLLSVPGLLLVALALWGSVIRHPLAYRSLNAVGCFFLFCAAMHQSESLLGASKYASLGYTLYIRVFNSLFPVVPGLIIWAAGTFIVSQGAKHSVLFRSHFVEMSRIVVSGLTLVVPGLALVLFFSVKGRMPWQGLEEKFKAHVDKQTEVFCQIETLSETNGQYSTKYDALEPPASERVALLRILDLLSSK